MFGKDIYKQNDWLETELKLGWLDAHLVGVGHHGNQHVEEDNDVAH